MKQVDFASACFIFYAVLLVLGVRGKHNPRFFSDFSECSANIQAQLTAVFVVMLMFIWSSDAVRKKVCFMLKLSLPRFPWPKDFSMFFVNPLNIGQL